MRGLLSITLILIGCSYVTSQFLFSRFQNRFREATLGQFSRIRQQRQTVDGFRPGNRLGSLVTGESNGQGNGRGGRGPGGRGNGRGGGRGNGNGGNGATPGDLIQPPPTPPNNGGPNDPGNAGIIKKDDEIRRGPDKSARRVVEGGAGGAGGGASVAGRARGGGRNRARPNFGNFGFFNRFGNRLNGFRDAFQKVRLITAGEGLGIPKKFALNLKPGVDEKQIQDLIQEFSKNKGRKLGIGKSRARSAAMFSRRGDSIFLEDVDASDLQKLLQRADLVEEIEQEIIVEALACNKIDAGSRSEYYKWGIDRIDSPNRTTADDNTLNLDGDGSGVDIYVIDTGIRSDHTEFQLLGGSRRVDSEFFSVYGDYAGAAEDDNGHGTHVAGTVGGRTWGVARNANLISVKILDWSGKGGSFDVARGIQWATEKAVSRRKKAIINLSIGSAVSTLLDNVVKEAIESGIIVTVASGNNGGDSCQTSPARVADAITVGAVDREDKITWYSNRGACTNVYAPGHSIGSSWYSASTAAAALSGTSMAAPHVAGVVAAHLSTIPPPGVYNAAFVRGVTQVVLGKAMGGVIQGTQAGDNDRFLQTGCAA